MPTQQIPLRYSQNFLRNAVLVERLIAGSGIAPEDLVLEIGPGRGIITAALAPRCRRLIAVERDPVLASHLRQYFAGDRRVAVHEADFLRFPLPRVPYKVFANIPFSATAAIVGRLTAPEGAPDDMHLVVQREAAQRFVGSPSGTLAGLLLMPRFEPAIAHRFARTDFDPAPRVEVVLLRLRKRGPPLLTPGDERRYRDLAVHAFTAWRPTLYDALEPLCGRRCCRALWETLGLPRAARPSAVPFDRWLALFRGLTESASPGLWQTVAGAEMRLRRQQAGVEKRHRTSAPLRRSYPPPERHIRHARPPPSGLSVWTDRRPSVVYAGPGSRPNRTTGPRRRAGDLSMVPKEGLEPTRA